VSNRQRSVTHGPTPPEEPSATTFCTSDVPTEGDGSPSRLIRVLETASWARRIVALFVDWAASTGVVILAVGWDRYAEVGSRASWYVPVVFALESALFTAFVGGSFGQVATRIRVIRTDTRRPPDLMRALLRSVLICLVVPPLVFKPDGRGLHDLAAGTQTALLDDLMRA
jgi:uncharacterized RDD family membrane protein YckC